MDNEIKYFNVSHLVKPSELKKLPNGTHLNSSGKIVSNKSHYSPGYYDEETDSHMLDEVLVYGYKNYYPAFKKEGNIYKTYYVHPESGQIIQVGHGYTFDKDGNTQNARSVRRFKSAEVPNNTSTKGSRDDWSIVPQQELDNIFNSSPALGSTGDGNFLVQQFDYGDLNQKFVPGTTFNLPTTNNPVGANFIQYTKEDAEKTGYLIQQGLRLLNGESIDQVFPPLSQSDQFGISSNVRSSMASDAINAAQTYLNIGGNQQEIGDTYNIGKWYLSNKNKPVALNVGNTKVQAGIVPADQSKLVNTDIYGPYDERGFPSTVSVPATQEAVNAQNEYIQNNDYELGQLLSDYNKQDPADNFLNWGMAFPKATATYFIGSNIGDGLVDLQQMIFGNNVGNILYNGLTDLGVHPSLAVLASPEYLLGFEAVNKGMNLLKGLGKNIQTPSVTISRPVMFPSTQSAVANALTSQRGKAVGLGLGFGTFNAAANTLSDVEATDVIFPIVAGLFTRSLIKGAQNKFGNNPPINVEVQKTKSGKSKKTENVPTYEYVTATPQGLVGRKARTDYNLKTANDNLRTMGSPYRLVLDSEGKFNFKKTLQSRLKPSIFGLGAGLGTYWFLNDLGNSGTHEYSSQIPSNDSSAIINSDTTNLSDTILRDSLSKILTNMGEGKDSIILNQNSDNKKSQDSTSNTTQTTQTQNDTTSSNSNDSTTKSSQVTVPTVPSVSSNPENDIKFNNW